MIKYDIRKIWSSFSRDILRNWFIQGGIVNSDPRLYHNKLCHFAQTWSLIADVEPVEEQIYEFRAFDRESGEELMEGQDKILVQDDDDLMDNHEE